MNYFIQKIWKNTKLKTFKDYLYLNDIKINYSDHLIFEIKKNK